MLEDYKPPTLAERLTHPFAIAAILGVSLVGSFVGYRMWTDYQREQTEEALEPYRQGWAALQKEAVAHFDPLLRTLDDGVSGSAKCPELGLSELDVVHRPMLHAIVEGEPHRDGTGPSWLNSNAFAYLAGDLTPGNSVQAHQTRADAVERLLKAPAFAVLESDAATNPELVGDKRFDGGDVAGRLRIIRVSDPAVVCAVEIRSAPLFAISVKQDSVRQQPSSDRAAVQQSAQSSYWDAVDEALETIAPAIRSAPH